MEFHFWLVIALLWRCAPIYFKVRGSENPADLCTKHLTRTVIDGLIEICGIAREAGRAASAPRLNVEAEPLPTKPHGESTLLASLCL